MEDFHHSSSSNNSRDIGVVQEVATTIMEGIFRHKEEARHNHSNIEEVLVQTSILTSPHLIGIRIVSVEEMILVLLIQGEMQGVADGNQHQMFSLLLAILGLMNVYTMALNNGMKDSCS